ncbi:MAG TPA: type II toxin-antitoxin system VapC family toxin [Hyphomonas sp.]|nr:type II toxin-antitoxin system VapC family toxin [Hyphomonas sp.]
MRITPDTNLLVRAIVADDLPQARSAQDLLARAELVALTLPTLCELVWVLARGYRIGSLEIAGVVRRLIRSETAVVNRPAADAGLAMLELGGDFADGVIAYEGAWLGSEEFVSFDKKAVALAINSGFRARLPD